MFLKQTLVAVLAIVLMSGTCTSAYASVITTQQAMSAETRAATEQHVRAALARDDVRRAMQQYGANPADVDARIASLSDQELLQVQGQVDKLPVGGDVIWIVGVVFIVLIILDLVGVTHVFTKV